MRCLAIILALAATTAVLRAEQPNQEITKKIRQSIDGVPFPDVIGQERFKVMLPLVRDKLGATPEESGLRIFNTAKSTELLQRRTKANIDSEWFAIGFRNADVVGIDLTDGRISKISLWFNHEQTNLSAAVTDGMTKLSRSHEMSDDGTVYILKNSDGSLISVRANAGTLVATFVIDPVDCYLLNHHPATEVATAMRERRPAVAMTVDEASIIWGKPETTAAEGQTQRLEWSEFAYPKTTGGGRVVSADELYQSMQIAVLNAHKVRSRLISATVKDGAIVEFSDQKE
jgi:hypothetical protein